MGRTPPGRTREKVYRFLRKRLLEGRPPTVREVQERFGFQAVQTAREHLEKLVDEGRLIKQPGRSRGYRLPHQARETPTTLVPVLGNIQAGPDGVAVEELEDYVPVQSREGELFGLRVRGESMRDAGILNGDLAIVRRQETARSGEIVVALIGDEATVKLLRRSGRKLELHPKNPRFKPIVPEPHEFHLLGKVIEIRRSL